MRSRGRLRMVPLSGDSSPRIMRKSVVLPAPFGPTSPTRNPDEGVPMRPQAEFSWNIVYGLIRFVAWQLFNQAER